MFYQIVQIENPKRNAVLYFNIDKSVYTIMINKLTSLLCPLWHYWSLDVRKLSPCLWWRVFLSVMLFTWLCILLVQWSWMSHSLVQINTFLFNYYSTMIHLYCTINIHQFKNTCTCVLPFFLSKDTKSLNFNFKP